MKELVMSWVCARCFCGLEPKIMKMKNEMKKSNEKAFSLDTCIISYMQITMITCCGNLFILFFFRAISSIYL